MLPRLHSVREPRRAGDRVTQDMVMLHNWINWGREGIRYLIRASYYHCVWPDQTKWPDSEREEDDEFEQRGQSEL